MKLVFDRHFIKQVKKLPKTQQKKLSVLLIVLQNNPFHSKLHTKQLSTPLQGLFSFRINREYRVLFRFIDEETIFLTSVKHRKDIYR